MTTKANVIPHNVQSFVHAGTEYQGIQSVDIQSVHLGEIEYRGDEGQFAATRSFRRGDTEAADIEVHLTAESEAYLSVLALTTVAAGIAVVTFVGDDGETYTLTVNNAQYERPSGQVARNEDGRFTLMLRAHRSSGAPASRSWTLAVAGT
jgi:hypothetical protein